MGITSFDYWFNWRVFLCALWVLTPMIVALFVIWKYEDSTVVETQLQNGNGNNDTGFSEEDVLCIDDTWKPCFKQIHPGWLLGFRVLGFCFLLTSNIVRLAFRGWRIYYYYTQWTFTLIAIYFGMGTLFSIYGCFQHKKRLAAEQVGNDAENGFRSPLINGENMVSVEKKKTSDSKMLRSCVHLFQIIFQMSAGAAVLTDSIYWTVIFPFLSLQDYEMSFMTVNLHTSNLVLLVCDTALNRLRFPLFRFSYFILLTGSFVIFQWILHVFISVGWPYPFLDLSYEMAPVW
ncbi:hypothetical protein AALP_AA5G046500 [Arabis alpina]|uniref:Uncharacterized protein n=1 Tax=Arabis alpina TaxID=50452 RepID=A0A087GUY3_ARAAL|nr:hypothetical protein AALP_AA5G046500 [Arabis alpina]